MSNKPNPFAGKKVIFATSNDPTPLAQFGGAGVVVAVMPGTTPEQVAAIRATGADVAYWDPQVSDSTVANAQKLGINTVIGQVEGPSQLNNYNSAYGSKPPGVTMGMVTSNGSAYYSPNGDFMMVEAYPGEVPGQTVDNAMANANAVNPNMPVIPVIGGANNSTAAEQAAAASRYGSYGIFPSGMQNTAEINSMLAPPLSGATATSSTTSSSSSSAPPKPQPKPKAKKPLAVTPPKQPPGAGLGIQHEKPLKEVASHGYKGEDNPKLTYSYTDQAKKDNTLTFRPNGMVIQTKADGTSFVVWDPSKHNGEHWPGFAKNNIKDPYEGASINENANAKVAEGTKTPSGEATPAWHQNPGWKDLDPATKQALQKLNGINPSQVLEEREGANSDIVIFRMADGTYKSYNSATGQVSNAGTWNNTQWNESGYGPKLSATGSTTSSGKPKKGGGSDTGGDSSATSSETAGSSKTPSGEATPAWHANPNWKSSHGDNLDFSNVKGVDNSQVLETRPGKNGNTILRMADGTYKSVNADGSVTGAGTWDNTKWNDTGYGPTISPDGTVHKHGGSGSNPTDSTASTPPTGGATNPTSSSTTGQQTATTGGLGELVAAPRTACFPAGSLILTAKEHVSIEQVKLGEKIVTWNFDKETTEETTVTDTLAHKSRATLIVKTGHSKIITTPEHPFWDGEEWVAAEDLRAGHSNIMDHEGDLHLVQSVHDGPKLDVYNLHVKSPAHNYFVDGFLVHNMKVIN